MVIRDHWPLASVLIPSYNYRRYIAHAIDSARSQTYPNVEVIVSDNCSTDGTVPMLRERYAADPRVRIDVNATNVGMIRNFNEAFARSRGDFVLWLSADDFLLPEHLWRLVQVFEREPQLDVVYSGAYLCDEAGRIFGKRTNAGQFPCDYVDARDELVEMLTTHVPLCWPTALFRRSCFERFGLFDPEGPLAGDWEMQVRFAANGLRFGYLHDASAVVRFHAGQLTGVTYSESGRATTDLLDVVERYIDHPAMRRMRGRELGIASNIDRFAIATRQLNANAFDAEQTARIEAVKERLLERHRTYEPALARSWRVSYVVVAWGNVQLALRAIESIGAQTHPDVEIVVVDMGVPLGPLLRAHALWPRISYVHLPAPRSLGAARNLGLRMARGELVGFLEATDTLAPDHTTALVDLVADGGFEIVAAPSRLVIERSEPIPAGTTTPVGAIDGLFREPHVPHTRAGIANALPLGATLFYRRVPLRAGSFAEGLPVLDDFDFLVRAETTAAIGMTVRPTHHTHVTIGLAHLALGLQVGEYLGSLDAVYAAYPGLAPGAARAQHRAAVMAALSDVKNTTGTADGVISLIRTLAGTGIAA